MGKNTPYKPGLIRSLKRVARNVKTNYNQLDCLGNKNLPGLRLPVLIVEMNLPGLNLCLTEIQQTNQFVLESVRQRIQEAGLPKYEKRAERSLLHPTQPQNIAQTNVEGHGMNRRVKCAVRFS